MIYPKAILPGLILLCIGCTKSNVAEDITANLDKIIITDNIENSAIYFFITFENKSNQEIKLFSNSFYNKTYKAGGIIIRIDELTSPIGGVIPKDNKLILKANNSIKYLFVYAKQYPNKWIKKEIIDSNIKAELTDIAKRASLHYYFSEDLEDDLEERKTYARIKEIPVKKQNYTIEVKREISLEEAMKLVNSKDFTN